MAQQGSYFKRIFSVGSPAGSSNQGYIGMGGLNISSGGIGGNPSHLTIADVGGGALQGNRGRVVVDPWNNKYYGDSPVESYLSHWDSQIKQIDRKLTANKTYVSPFKTREYTPEEKASLIAQKEAFTKEKQDFQQNYVQSKDFFASYEAYQADWDKYFEGSYRNTRIEAEQKQQSATDQADYARRMQEANDKQQLLAANNSLNISPPRTVGTGVSASRDTQINSLKGGGGTGLAI